MNNLQEPSVSPPPQVVTGGNATKTPERLKLEAGSNWNLFKGLSSKEKIWMFLWIGVIMLSFAENIVLVSRNTLVHIPSGDEKWVEPRKQIDIIELIFILLPAILLLGMYLYLLYRISPRKMIIISCTGVILWVAMLIYVTNNNPVIDVSQEKNQWAEERYGIEVEGNGITAFRMAKENGEELFGYLYENGEIITHHESDDGMILVSHPSLKELPIIYNDSRQYTKR